MQRHEATLTRTFAFLLLVTMLPHFTDFTLVFRRKGSEREGKPLRCVKKKNLREYKEKIE